MRGERSPQPSLPTSRVISIAHNGPGERKIAAMRRGRASHFPPRPERHSMTTDQVYSAELEELLAGINFLAAQRPVTARIVAATEAEDTDARELSRVLAMDLPLAGRVMKLANSAYYGMRGRVTSLQLAVTVVGFTTVRTMATVALTELDDESRLPEDFWVVSTSLAVTAARLAPAFGERPADGLCVGVL